MPLILDTFNVLHTVGVLPPDLAGIDVPGLAFLILRSRYRAQKMVFACDGLPAADLPAPGRMTLDEVAAAIPEAAGADITIRYSGPKITADDLIRDLINASTAPRRLIVISSDHAVQRQARKRRCTVFTSQEFLQQLADDARLPRSVVKTTRPIPPAMSEAQVDRWLDVFGVDEESLRLDQAGHGDDDQSKSEPATQAGPERSAGPRILPRKASAPRESSNCADSDAAPTDNPLPADLIADAEALWQREQSAMRPPARGPSTAPPTTTPAETESPDHSPDVDRHPESPDLADLDMNAILPADGRTQPLRKRGNRHRST